MKWQYWFRNWLTQPRTRRASRVRTLRCGDFRRRTITPWLEPLEDRTLPSTFTVTNLLDDGSAGSLRYEIQAANNTSGANAIDFAHGLHGVITLTQGQLNVTNSLTIDGPGANKLAINGNAASRIFDISGGTTVTLAGLTLSNGHAATGAGIYNAGVLTLSKDVLSDNVAQGAANGGNAFGGGLYNNAGGVVTIDQSTFSGNQAVGGDGGVTSTTGSTNGETATLASGIRGILVGVGMGGGLWNDGGALTITNSTFSDNLAQGGNNSNVSALSSSAQFVFAGTADGGAIGSGAFFTTATPTVSIADSTLSDNQAIGGTNVNYSLNTPSDAGNSHGGGLGALAGNVSISNSTITDNLSEDGANQTAAGGSTFVSGGTTYTFTFQEGLGGSASGGGIDDEFYPGHFITPAVTPTLRISGSTLSNNVALGNGGQGSGNGGGLNTLFVNTQLTESTVNGNQAISGPGGETIRTTGKAVTSKGAVSTFRFSGPSPGGGTASGGGLLSVGGSLTISGSTVNGNAAKGSPGGTQGCFPVGLGENG
jgi:fibronectin-binding autotransporter adhesin